MLNVIIRKVIKLRLAQLRNHYGKENRQGKPVRLFQYSNITEASRNWNTDSGITLQRSKRKMALQTTGRCLE